MSPEDCALVKLTRGGPRAVRHIDRVRRPPDTRVHRPRVTRADMESPTIGSYRIIDALGQGAMGVVYRARHVTSERAVALKTVRVPSPRLLDGIRREIRALTRIRHPGVVRILDDGVHEGRPWYAMDLLEGESLRHFGNRVWSPFRVPLQPVGMTEGLTETDALPRETSLETASNAGVADPRIITGLAPAAGGELKAVMRILRRICATLAYLHGEGFINCDLKPENILLMDGQPVIIDFGLTAHHPGGSSREALEASGSAAGTIPYMSPEQLRGEFLDARSDLYSVGCLLYELVVGAPPFSGAPRQVMTGHLETPPVPPSERVSGVPARLERVILRLLSKNLNDRYGHADEVAAELAELAEDVARLSEFPPARPYLYRPRFVGREALLQHLVMLRERAADGAGAFALIGGESGVGKTRLAMEVTRFAPPSRMLVVAGESSALSASSAAGVGPAPLHTVRPLLQAVADRCQEGGSDVTEQLLGHRRAVLALYEPLLAEVPAREPLAPAAVLGAAQSRQRLFTYLAEVIAAFAHERPLLWIIDDIGWGDELSLAFLRSLTPDFFESAPVLIVCTYRSEERPEAVAELAALAHVKHVVLPRLEPPAVQTMLTDMLAVRELPRGFVELIAREAEGNPFFVGEYLRTAVTERALVRRVSETQEGGTAEAHANIALPRSIREHIQRRLAQLTPVARQTVLAAAVLGREVESGALCTVADLVDESSVEALNELLRRQVLEQREPGKLRFAHDKLREVIYAGASRAQLRDLHLRAARALESRTAAGEGGLWATLAHHFAIAELREPTIRYLTLAADEAKLKFANGEAIRLYREAIRVTREEQLLLTSDERSWNSKLAAIHESLGDVLGLPGEREEARASYQAALEYGERTDSVGRARLQRKLGKSWEAGLELDDALRCYAAARRTLPADPSGGTSPERDEWIQVCIEELWVHYWRNSLEDMEAASRSLGPVVRSHGTPAQKARFFHTQALERLRRERYAVGNETLELAREAVGACVTGHALAELPMVRFLLGFALLFHDSLDAAETELAEALRLAELSGERSQQARCLTYLTLVSRRRGLVDVVVERAERTERVSSQSAMREYLAAAWAHQGWAALKRGERDAARRAAERACGVWRELKAVFPFQWLARLILVECELADGATERAVEHAEPLLARHQHALPARALGSFEEGRRFWAEGEHSRATASLRAGLGALAEAGYH